MKPILKNKQILESAELSGERFYLNISSSFSGFQGGGKFGNRAGQSLEFVEHRDYQPGDDIRHLDWGAVARTDKLAIKLFREEVTPHLDVFLDLSASMAVNEEKFNALAAMAVILAKSASNSGYTYDSWLIKDMCTRVEPAYLPLDKWQGFNADFSGNSGKTINDFFPKLRAGGVRIVISDLFWDYEPMKILRRLSEGASAGIILQLVAKRDINPDVYGNIRVVDSESGEALELICDDNLLTEYKANFERHRQYWKECCTRMGVLFSFIEAENLLKDFMPDELIKNEILVV